MILSKDDLSKAIFQSKASSGPCNEFSFIALRRTTNIHQLLDGMLKHEDIGKASQQKTCPSATEEKQGRLESIKCRPATGSCVLHVSRNQWLGKNTIARRAHVYV